MWTRYALIALVLCLVWPPTSVLAQTVPGKGPAGGYVGEVRLSRLVVDQLERPCVLLIGGRPKEAIPLFQQALNKDSNDLGAFVGLMQWTPSIGNRKSWQYRRHQHFWWPPPAFANPALAPHLHKSLGPRRMHQVSLFLKPDWSSQKICSARRVISESSP